MIFEGTPAARMKKVASNVVKKRSRELTSVFESFTPYNGMEGNIKRIWITDIATDEIHLVNFYFVLQSYIRLRFTIFQNCSARYGQIP